MKSVIAIPQKRKTAHAVSPEKTQFEDYIIRITPALGKKLKKLGISPMEKCIEHGGICVDAKKFEPQSDREKALQQCAALYSSIVDTPIQISRHTLKSPHCYYVISHPCNAAKHRFYMCLADEIGSVIAHIADPRLETGGPFR